MGTGDDDVDLNPREAGRDLAVLTDRQLRRAAALDVVVVGVAVLLVILGGIAFASSEAGTVYGGIAALVLGLINVVVFAGGAIRIRGELRTRRRTALAVGRRRNADMSAEGREATQRLGEPLPPRRST